MPVSGKLFIGAEQVATATGRTPDSVRNILARALNQLATELERGEVRG